MPRRCIRENRGEGTDGISKKPRIRVFSSTGMHSRVGDLWPWTRNDKYPRRLDPVKDGRELQQKLRRKLSAGLANAKPFHLRDYGTSIFSARDPVASRGWGNRAGEGRKKNIKRKMDGEIETCGGLMRLGENLYVEVVFLTTNQVSFNDESFVKSSLGLLVGWYRVTMIS